MTLFGGDLLTPAQRQETAVRKGLELRRQFWPHTDKGYIYRGGGDLLLQHGTFYSGRELPEEYRHLFRVDGGEGNCFRNAWHATREDPSLRYVEGVYAWAAGHFTPHAWCLDPDGQLLELTVETDPAQIAGAREYRTHMPMVSPDRWGYWGAVFHPDYISAVSELEEGYGGVLDRPEADRRDGEQYTELREHWPVFTYPYDPNRKTP